MSQSQSPSESPIYRLTLKYRNQITGVVYSKSAVMTSPQYLNFEAPVRLESDATDEAGSTDILLLDSVQIKIEQASMESLLSGILAANNYDWLKHYEANCRADGEAV